MKTIFPSLVILYYPTTNDYKAFMTGGLQDPSKWLRGSINGQHSFSKDEFKQLKTEKITKAVYAYKGE